MEFVCQQTATSGTQSHSTHRASVRQGATRAAEGVAVTALERWRRDSLQTHWTLQQGDHGLEAGGEPLEADRGRTIASTLENDEGV